jgi:uncharacterized membrane protein YgcG
MSAQSKTEIMAGNINEMGWLKSLNAMGFDPNRCISEFIGNSLDAKAKNIKIHIDGKIGFIVDDGRGMTKKGLTGMFAVYSSHGHIHRIGNYGFGAKAAFANLGKNGLTKVITKSEDSPIFTATADWKKMYAEGKYTGNIKIDESDVSEQEIYSKYLPESPSGSIMMFPVDVDIIESIQTQFGIKSAKSESIKPWNTWRVIFGKFDVNISYSSNDGAKKDLVMYNPMKSDQIDGPVPDYSIRYYKHPINGHKRFITRKLDTTDNQIKDFEVASSDSSNWCATKIAPVKSKLDEYEFVSEINLKLYKMKVPGQISGANIMSDYDKDTLGDICEADDIMFDFVPNGKLIRNDNFIGCIPLAKTAARASGDARFKMLIHSDILTKPMSTQDDPTDQLYDVQTNKQQNNPNPSKAFTRLVDNLKDEFCEELKLLAPDAIKPKPPKKEKKEKKEKKDETTSTDGNDDDNSSTSSNSTSSSKSNQKIGGGSSGGGSSGGGSSGGGSNIEFEVVDDVDDVVDDVDDDITRAGGGAPMGGGGGSASPVKTKKPIDVPGYRKALVLGSELQEKLGSLYTRVNAEQNYDDADYIALFNILQKIENK